MDDEVKWYLRPTVVVILLFFVLGVLALPLLYRSPKFSRTSKAVLTVIVAVYTFYMVFSMRIISGFF